MSADPRPPSVERFEIDSFRCEAAGEGYFTDSAAAARRASDPANAVETIHWGRNYLYSVRLEGRDEIVPAVVKVFRNLGWRRRLERRVKGSKAERSWRIAHSMRAHGVPTPEPLLLLESVAPDGPSIFVTRQVEDCVEARYVFRALKAGSLATEFPEIDARQFLRRVAQTARAMHDAGFWHRDFSIGNLLLETAAPGGLSIDLIDLNRARHKGRVSVSQRTRDLCRLGFYDPELDALFIEEYWSDRSGGLWLERLLYRLYRTAYLGRVEGKKALRGVTAFIGQMLFLRKPYAHIPPPPADADRRDKSVWDELSDQPHQHASRAERLSVRLGDLGSHVRAYGAAIVSLPRARRRYRRLMGSLWSEPVAWPGLGIAIGPDTGEPEELAAAVGELGVSRALLRIHPWDKEWSAQEELAALLSRRGTDLLFALPQVREMVREPDLWRRRVRAIGERFLPFGRRFQIGQAINRSKWGLWNYGEYVDLAAAAAGELRSLGEVELLGPAVIDFEPHAMAAALNYPGASDQFDIVSSLLYVDRRGAPENRQLGHDCLEKAAQLCAIGQTARRGSDRFWITEFNWPLWEGPHSPAGRTVSVDEERQASYLVRYAVPILASGLAERAYWWQLVARGYGLLNPTDEGLRPRLAFAAMRTLERQLAETTAHGPLTTSLGTRAYRFTHPDRGEIVVAWSLEDGAEIELESSPRRIVSRDGSVLDPSGSRIELSGSPVYLRFT